MRFLIDECTGPAVAKWLRKQGHGVFSIFEQARRMDDEEIIKLTFEDARILITNDKDFGEKIFRDMKPHKGIILLRLNDEKAKSKIVTDKSLIENYSDLLHGNFIVATEHRVRIASR